MRRVRGSLLGEQDRDRCRGDGDEQELDYHRISDRQCVPIQFGQPFVAMVHSMYQFGGSEVAHHQEKRRCDLIEPTNGPRYAGYDA